MASLARRSNAEFREAVAEAAALHSCDDWTGAMAEASDDEDDAPMPELIDMPPAPASAPRMSNLERCIALRLVATRRSHRPKKKNKKMSQMIIVTCGLFSCAVVFVVCPAQDSLVTKKKKQIFFWWFLGRW